MQLPTTVTALSRQTGSLMLVTLIILLVISLIGMSTVDTTGLEMHMTSNSRQQQQLFEAAEYTLAQVENNLNINGYFTTTQLKSSAGCGAICFSSACTNGYCANLTHPASYSTCALSIPTTENYANSTIWTTGSGKYQTLVVPIVGSATGITTKYIIEDMCYVQSDPTLPPPMTVANHVHLYRITTLATGEDGRSRVMLRSSVRGGAL